MISETSSNSNPSGVYKHRETGEELVCIATSKFGNPQADAAMRVGFVYDRPLDKKQETFVDPHAAPAASPIGTRTVADIEAELAEAKAREASQEANKKEAEKVNQLADKQANAPEANAAKSSSKKGAN